MMIADFRRPGLADGVLATCLFAVLGLASFTTAATPAGEGAASPSAGQLREIAVVFHQQPPAWRAELRERLRTTKLSFNCGDCSLSDVVEYVRLLTGLNVVVAPEVLEETGELEFSFQAEGISVSELLEMLCEHVDELEICLLREAIFLGPRNGIPQTLELRFYKIGPLLDLMPLDDRCEAMDIVSSLTMEMTQFDGAQGRWDAEGVWIEAWDDLLVVNQTVATHERVQAFLNRLLNRGKEPESVQPAWERELHDRLGEPAEVLFEDQDFLEALEILQARYAVPLRLEADDWFDPIDLHLGGVSLETVIDWLADLAGLHVQLRREGVVFSHRIPKELRFYEVGDLFGPTWNLHHSDLRDRVEETARNTIDTQSWDDDPACMITYWADMMLVVQSEGAHGRIAELLDTVRRATAK